jgi:hypothetical protein
LQVDEGIAYAIQTFVQVQLTLKEPFFQNTLVKNTLIIHNEHSKIICNIHMWVLHSIFIVILFMQCPWHNANHNLPTSSLNLMNPVMYCINLEECETYRGTLTLNLNYTN